MSPNDENQTTISAKLVWQEDGGIREVLINKEQTIHLGRDESNEIVLPSREVSKQHATVSWQDDGFGISDLGSSNGTILNGYQITEPTTLQEGDRIEIGEYIISYYFLGERLIEELKTMPLTDPAMAAAAQAVIEPQDPEELIEHTPTLISPAVTAEDSEPITLEDMVTSEHDTPRETIVLEESMKDFEDIPNLDDDFELLLEQLQVVQDSVQGLKDKGETLSAKISTLAGMSEGLGQVSQRMVQLDNKISASNLADLLDKLSANPYDVTVLMDLAQHAELIKDMIEQYSIHKDALDKIHLEFEAELTQKLS